ncbi:MAG TPA: MBL fold metallo-hydrolase [Pedomonas sp.]|uniref:MBL fold metallo-hydrolase n=1 Tax=Pedomonas sp. TaxID=2976421 RepID=UPI002F4015F5
MRATFSSLAVLAALLAAAPAPVTPATAATLVQPGSEAQQPGGYRFRVGDAVVTALTDGSTQQDIRPLMHGATPEEIDQLLARDFLVNPVEMSMNAFLVEMGERKILVDVGAGEEFGPNLAGKMRDGLAALGVKPDEITDVLITHAHMDHIGGLAYGGKPAFPKATIHLGQHDAAFFGDTKAVARTGYPEAFVKTYARTVGVYPAAQVRPFTGTAEILPGITATEHPGHTPGTAIYTLTSKGQSIHFVGDTVHVASVQLRRPAVTMSFDIDPKNARKVRETVFARFADDAALIAGPHLQFPGVGRLRKLAENSYEWVPIEYRNRAETHANH